MKCTNIKLQGGQRVIVCGSQRVDTCVCGQIGTRLCDWKTTVGCTCDVLLCNDCSTSPAERKDLCRAHAELWGLQLSAELPQRAD